MQFTSAKKKEREESSFSAIAADSLVITIIKEAHKETISPHRAAADNYPRYECGLLCWLYTNWSPSVVNENTR